MIDYKKCAKYFTQFSIKVPAVLIIVGLLFLSMVSSSALMGLIGVILIAAGVAYIVLVKKGIPTDAEYDAICHNHVADVKQQALNKLGVDEDEVKEIAPITIEGYNYKGYNNIKQSKNDNLWRTDKYQSVWLFFSENEVHMYKYNFFTTDNRKTESTEVYFYKDIVSVSTTSESSQVQDSKGKQQTLNYEQFVLRTSGGTALEVALFDLDNAQRSINAMRALLRQKKMG